jgi:hypothetical protein
MDIWIYVDLFMYIYGAALYNIISIAGLRNARVFLLFEHLKNMKCLLAEI